ncbi:MAG: flagellar basal-body MS-ring/collar protein FliF [Syntrophomonadaceae bacterium]|jgi:flagellar M-ring protein FliF
MESLVGNVKQWGKGFKTTWSNLSLNKKVIYAAAGLFILVVFLVMASRGGKDKPYQILYTELDERDAAAVVEKLTEMNIAYKLQDSGTTISVPAELKDSVRLTLAGENIPRGESGFELFAQNSFGETQTDKKVKYQAALQGELARSIQSLQKVKAAKVNLALPEESLYSDNEQEAKAAVVINTRDNEKLNPKEVQAITNLVANSVKDLKPENVVIVDQYGNMVSDDIPVDVNNAGEIVQMQLAMKREYEKEKEEAIQSMLDQVLGKDNSVVRVNAELNFNDKQQVDEHFTHDPEGPFIISESIKKDSGTQTQANQPGVPGTDNNIPQYEEVTTEEGTSTWDKSDKTVNYNLNRTETVTRFSVGDVKYDYLTVSVFINRLGTENANIGDSEEEKVEKIRGIVAAACGLRENRPDENISLEDNISVAFIDFYTVPEAEPIPPGALQRFTSLSFVPWLMALIATLLMVFIWWQFKRKGQNEKELVMEPSGFESVLEDTIDMADVIEQSLTPEEKERQRIREKVDEIINDNPETAAQVIKVWLLEDMR